MTTVDFITFCCPKDIVRLSQPGELTGRVKSHHFTFSNVHVIRQRCKGEFDNVKISSPDFTVTEWQSEDFPDILKEYGLPENDAKADEMTHGPTAPHYWKWHVINHLIGLKVSTADFVVFSDCDCKMVAQEPPGWVVAGVSILNTHPNVLIVSPGDGGDMAEKIIAGGVRLTQNVSQQLFICNRERLSRINFNVPWNWELLAPGGPMQEYYFMLEGRIWRYMNDKELYRAILPDTWRYWHDQWH